MVRPRTRGCVAGCGSPRASGGGPVIAATALERRRFSPRERGWSVLRHHRPGRPTVLPARAGVVRWPDPAKIPRGGSPRASGGGPTQVRAGLEELMFSPRERGWSGPPGDLAPPPSVLPARAGVVLHRTRRRACPSCSPRASGGGPSYDSCESIDMTFSPRERGWSSRAARPVRCPSPCSPRASGGGPPVVMSNIYANRFSPRERGWSDVLRRRLGR